MTRRAAALLGITLVAAACQSGSTPSTEPAPSSAPVTASPAVRTTTAAPTTPAATTTIATTTIPPATAPPTTATPLVQELEIGRSVEGRPITAIERGTPGGRAVLVIGCIHGDEDAGTAVVQQLMTAPVPDGVDLWLVPSMNPDGQAHQIRTNANKVDLNRNFPQNWGPLGEPGNSQYAGTGPASEPETAAIVALISRVKPALAVWYHQDLNRIDVGSGRAGEIQRKYAELTGLPVEPVTGGIYTGTATQWEAATVPRGIAFIVELGPTIEGDGAATHAGAVLTLASSS